LLFFLKYKKNQT